MGVDKIRQCSRMKRMENGADVESAQSEICWEVKLSKQILKFSKETRMKTPEQPRIF